MALLADRPPAGRTVVPKADRRGDIKGGTPHQEGHREMDNHHVDWMSANARSGSHTRSFLSLRRGLRDPRWTPENRPLIDTSIPVMNWRPPRPSVVDQVIVRCS